MSIRSITLGKKPETNTAIKIDSPKKQSVNNPIVLSPSVNGRFVNFSNNVAIPAIAAPESATIQIIHSRRAESAASACSISTEITLPCGFFRARYRTVVTATTIGIMMRIRRLPLICGLTGKYLGSLERGLI